MNGSFGDGDFVFLGFGVVNFFAVIDGFVARIGIIGRLFF